MQVSDLPCLWDRWYPLEELDTRKRFCHSCGARALPFEGWCQACKQVYQEQEDKRIQRRRKPGAGYSLQCVCCWSRSAAIWVIRDESWIVRVGEGHKFRISMLGLGWSTSCLDCVERHIAHPTSVWRAKPCPILVPGDYVCWSRNIVLVKKIKDRDIDPVQDQAVAILRDLKF